MSTLALSPSVYSGHDPAWRIALSGSGPRLSTDLAASYAPRPLLGHRPSGNLHSLTLANGNDYGSSLPEPASIATAITTWPGNA
ncbi:hypothetical protein FKM82_020440 [Ascaphus truei]